MRSDIIAAAGAGRMGRGIAVTFALAGYRIHLLDLKDRPDGEDVLATAMAEIEATLGMLARLNLVLANQIPHIMARILPSTRAWAPDALRTVSVVFEGVPETLDAKTDALNFIARNCPADAIIASTTSTILSTELQGLVTSPERFLNAHWLNPAYLVPLVELSPGPKTDPSVTARLKTMLESIGKVPVTCAPAPGYIVPRIQALAMNEAARLVEDGVASAEDIDKATRYGFGFRFAVLGLLEFIDWGGGDILFHASNYMAKSTGDSRFEPPRIVAENMQSNRNGLRDGAGFLDYTDRDIAAYQEGRLAAFLELLGHMDCLPTVADPTGPDASADHR